MQMNTEFSVQDLENRAFMAWLEAREELPLEPDPQDWDSAPANTTAEAVNKCWRAQASKLFRLYDQWKAGQK
jgi:hypothetical protein